MYVVNLMYSEHRCEKQGSGQVLVIDGNMKNHRDVCLATQAGLVEFAGLPGKVTTGCPATPQPNSRYCATHAPTAFTSQDQSGNSSSSHVEDQVAFITSKKTTKQMKAAKLLMPRCTSKPQELLHTEHS